MEAPAGYCLLCGKARTMIKNNLYHCPNRCPGQQREVVDIRRGEGGCSKVGRKYLSLLLCLLLLAQPVIGLAATYTMTETQMQNIEQLTSDLKRSIEVLNQNSEISISQLLQAEKKLQTLGELLSKSESASKEIQRLYGLCKLELVNLRLLYEKSELQKKRLQNENKILKVGLGIMIALEIARFFMDKK
jgi:hypothetical protein